MERLPSFEISPASPPLPEHGVAIAIELGATPAETVVRGSWRVPDDWPAGLHAQSAIWLVAVGRRSRLGWNGRPAGEALALAGDDPRRGWFNVSLGACCELPDVLSGWLDVVAVLGEWKSKPFELEFAAPLPRP